MTKQESVIERQIGFYNNHDLEGFISTYHDDIEIFNLNDSSLILRGKDGLSQRYREKFEVLKVQAKIVNRMIIADKIIDHEHITSAGLSEIKKAVVIYQIENGLIRKVWIINE